MPSPRQKQAGERRYFISVEQHNGNTSGGEPTYDVDTDWLVFKELAKVPATYEGISGGETVRGQKMEADATGLVTILSTARTRTITEDMRLRMKGRKLNIVSVLDIEGRERELWIQIKEQK